MRVILHADMDAFYASVEQHDNPDLRGKPVIVGGASARGVVAAASYEARRFGVRSAMPGSVARRRCPDGIFLKPRMSRYQEVSRQVFEIMRDITPLVEGLSLDEAFLDISGSLRQFGNAKAVGEALRERVRGATGLAISIGIAPNKFVAKIASDIDKPNGFVIVQPEDVTGFLDPLPVRRLWGIGPKTLPRLEQTGFKTFQDIRRAAPGKLEALLGRQAERYRQLAAGKDQREVKPDRDDKSISHEQTYREDLVSLEQLEREILQQAEKVAARLRAKELSARTLTLKIRERDFTTHTRSTSMRPATQDTRALADKGRQLIRQWWQEHPGARIRLLGVGSSNFEAATQLGLFDSAPAGRDTRLDKLMDSVRDKFGNSAVRRGRLLEEHSRDQSGNDSETRGKG